MGRSSHRGPWGGDGPALLTACAGQALLGQGPAGEVGVDGLLDAGPRAPVGGVAVALPGQEPAGLELIGRLLTWEGNGHTAYGRSGACVQKAVDTYLISGTMPEEGLTCKNGQ